MKLTANNDKPMKIGPYVLTSTGLEVHGDPTISEHLGVGDFIERAVNASGFWKADWIAYGESRPEWKSKIDAELGIDTMTLESKRIYGYIAKAVPPVSRLTGLGFAHHQAVASLPVDQQRPWLEKAQAEGWSLSEFRKELRASKRRGIVDGQAVLAGTYRVIYADPPWVYGASQPSGSGARDHYPGLSVEELCKLPVAAHTRTNAVLFLWVTSPFLMLNPGPREVIEAWGFQYKTGIVWDKVLHNFGNYVSVRHEHLLICTRGSCLPDRPTPMPDSVITERRTDTNSAKPESFRALIEKLYDGPYLELFGRSPIDGWQVFGNDASLWAQEAAR